MAMVYPDHETRVGAHRIFSVVLVPSSVCPSTSAVNSDAPKEHGFNRTLSRNVSVFSSSAALFEKLKKEKSPLPGNSCQENIGKSVDIRRQGSNSAGMLNRLKSSYSRVYSMKRTPLPSIPDEKPMVNSNKEVVCTIYIFLLLNLIEQCWCWILLFLFCSFIFCW